MSILKNSTLSLAALALVVGCSGKKNVDSSSAEAYGSSSSIASSKKANSLSKDSFVPDRVFFDFDSADLTSESMDSIKSQSEFLKASKAKVVIEGHCDIRGTDAYNDVLGQKRASAVKAALVKHGIKSDMVKVVTFGKQRPEVAGDNSDSHAANRRAVVVLKLVK